MSPLVRSGNADADDIEQLRARGAALETQLADREAEIGRVRSELAAFKIAYRQRVGRLHEELDDLERQIAELELGEINKRLEEGGAEAARGEAPAAADTGPRLSSDAVRRLFRDVARAIHPDLADDPSTRGHRHALMVEANRAYELGDEERLRWILQSWENRPEAIPGDDPDSTRERLTRRIVQLEERLVSLTGTLADLQDTPVWKMKAMVDEYSTRGKDLMRDMVRRLKRDILAARNRLDAMRSEPGGQR